MKIGEDIETVLDINNYEIIKKFKSRQNNVFLVSADTDEGKKNLVYKHHNSGNALKEIGILIELYNKGVKVPRIIKSSKNIIIMEYLRGETLIDRMGYLEKQNLSGEDEMSQIITFFYNFRKALADQIHWDINFSNFIFYEDALWGIDFEDVRKGEKETDMGRFFAFLITYSPSFTQWKLNFLANFYLKVDERFDIDKQKVKQAMMDEFSRMQERRHIAISPFDIQKIIF